MALPPQLTPLCRGHGTQLVDGRLLATTCGVVARVNKLVSVRPLKSRCSPGACTQLAMAAEAHTRDACRYTAETGDVVVGRITEARARQRVRKAASR